MQSRADCARHTAPLSKPDTLSWCLLLQQSADARRCVVSAFHHVLQHEVCLQLSSLASLKFRGCWNTGIYTCVYPRVVFRNAKTCIHISMGIAADALACGSLWTCSYRNAKFHFTVDPHHNKYAAIHAIRILGDLWWYRHA